MLTVSRSNSYIVCLTIGPAFFSASIYLCLARIIAVYGRQLSRLPPAAITITFMVLDFFALALQSTGGAYAGGADRSRRERGLAILQAGLSLHLAAIAIYVGISVDFAWSVWRRRQEWNLKFDGLQRSLKFKAFLAGAC